MRDRQERPGQGQRQRDRGNETKKNCHGAESQRHSKKHEAGGHCSWAPPEARLLGRCRTEERQFCAGIWGPGVKSAAKKMPTSHLEGQGSFPGALGRRLLRAGQGYEIC